MSSKIILLSLMNICLLSQTTSAISLDVPLAFDLNYTALASTTAGAGVGYLAYSYLIKGFLAEQSLSINDIQRQTQQLAHAITEKTLRYETLKQQLETSTTPQKQERLNLQLEKLSVYFTKAHVKLTQLNEMLDNPELLTPSSKQSLISWTAMCVSLGIGAYAGYRLYHLFARAQPLQDALLITELVPVPTAPAVPKYDWSDEDVVWFAEKCAEYDDTPKVSSRVQAVDQKTLLDSVITSLTEITSSITASISELINELSKPVEIEKEHNFTEQLAEQQ